MGLGYAYAVIVPVAQDNVATIIMVLLVLAATGAGYLRAVGPERQARLTAVAAAVAVAVPLTAGSVAPLLGPDTNAGPVLWGYEAALVLIALAFLADLRYGRWGQAAVTKLVVDLGEPGESGTLTVRLARALGEPRLVTERPGQLEDLRASRARVVAVGDAERRRLERDLHDGAQQRLVSLSLAVRLARTQLGPDEDPDLTSAMDRAGEEIGAAIEELRELAHGIYPAVLTDEGLAAAVEALCERAAIPVRVVAVPEARFPPPVEAATYFLVAEACGKIAVCIEASSITVEVTHKGGRLLVDVTEAGAGKPGPDVEARFTDLSDRVGALNGRLRIERLPSRGIAIHGEIPCGS